MRRLGRPERSRSSGSLFTEKLKFRDEERLRNRDRYGGEVRVGDLERLRPECLSPGQKLVWDEAQAGSLPRQHSGGKPVGFHGNWSPA